MAKHNRLFLFSYYGGKSKIAHLYPYPLFDTIVEPFAGAANYSCYHFKHKVVLFEKNPTIFGVLDFLIKSSEQDILALPLLEKGQVISDMPICEEAKDLIGLRCNFGSAQPKNSLSSRCLDSSTPVWGKATRFQLSCFVKRIKHWKVFLGQCWDAFERFKDQEVTWYIDPPYQGPKGDYYPHGSSKMDFKKLGSECQKLKGQVIVCEGEEADWLPFRKFHLNNGVSNNKGSWEMIWTKGCKKPMGFGL